MSPSFALRPAFFWALASPRLRRIVVASSKSPLASVSAFLHSIIPAPVWSRSFFTSAALIAVGIVVLQGAGRPEGRPLRTKKGDRTKKKAPGSREPAPRNANPNPEPRTPNPEPRTPVLRGRGLRLAARALRARGAARIRVLRIAVVVVARVFGVDRLLHVAARDHGVGDARREEPDRAQRVVVARNHEVDFVRIAVGVDDADHRNLQLARLVDGNLLFLRVDDEH